MPRSRKGLEDLMGSEERHIEEMELNILIGVRYGQRMGTGNFKCPRWHNAGQSEALGCH